MPATTAAPSPAVPVAVAATKEHDDSDVDLFASDDEAPKVKPQLYKVQPKPPPAQSKRQEAPKEVEVVELATRVPSNPPSLTLF